MLYCMHTCICVFMYVSLMFHCMYTHAVYIAIQNVGNWINREWSATCTCVVNWLPHLYIVHHNNICYWFLSMSKVASYVITTTATISSSSTSIVPSSSYPESTVGVCGDVILYAYMYMCVYVCEHYILLHIHTYSIYIAIQNVGNWINWEWSAKSITPSLYCTSHQHLLLILVPNSMVTGEVSQRVWGHDHLAPNLISRASPSFSKN